MVLHTSWVKEISCLAFFDLGMFTSVLLSISLILVFFFSFLVPRQGKPKGYDAQVSRLGAVVRVKSKDFLAFYSSDDKWLAIVSFECMST